mgnify:CR=1 FL=1
MKKLPWIRKLLPALAVLLLLAALWFVFTRTGPLAPIQVTVGQVDEGSVMPQRYWHTSVMCSSKCLFVLNFMAIHKAKSPKNCSCHLAVSKPI